MPILFADQWGGQAGAWKADDPSETPDVREAVKYFDDNVQIVDEDLGAGLLTLAIEWTDPGLGAKRANV